VVTNNDILYVLGPRNSGKTKSIERIISHLTSQGLIVGTIKFSHKNVMVEPSNKDTARVKSAGSTFSIFVTPIETSISIKKEKRDSIIDILDHIYTSGSLLPNTDFIICESLNDPPLGSKVLLVAFNEEELQECSNKLKNPRILAITGKISTTLERNRKFWNNIPIYNSLNQKDLSQICSLIISAFL